MHLEASSACTLTRSSHRDTATLCTKEVQAARRHMLRDNDRYSRAPFYHDPYQRLLSRQGCVFYWPTIGRGYNAWLQQSLVRLIRKAAQSLVTFLKREGRSISCNIKRGGTPAPAQCTLHTAHCTLHTAQCTMRNAQCTMHHAQ